MTSALEARGLEKHDLLGADCAVIVIGARCAGAPLAMLLARSGRRVLAVDRVQSPRESNTPSHRVEGHELMEAIRLCAICARLLKEERFRSTEP